MVSETRKTECFNIAALMLNCIYSEFSIRYHDEKTNASIVDVFLYLCKSFGRVRKKSRQKYEVTPEAYMQQKKPQTTK